MPKSVDEYLSKLPKSMPLSEKIAIGKKQGKIVQKGKHLGAGPKINSKAKRKK